MSPAKPVTIEDASPTPPPLPNEPLHTATETIDLPITSLGGGLDEEEEQEWDPAEERGPGESSSSGKGKGVAKGEEEGGDEQPWQAVWAPDQNAWYFWNSITGEVTWTNPLQPETANSSSELPNQSSINPTIPAYSSSQPPLPIHQPPLPQTRKFGALPEIDPSLAYLLPANQRGLADPEGQTAQFNSRTGRFTANDYTYTVDHLDEWNRAKRMSSRYFDVEAWEREKAAEHAKRKREEEMGVSSSKQITKKDMERFKRKKAEQKARSQAWLRD